MKKSLENSSLAATVARNVTRLMAHYDLKAHRLAKLAGVSLSTVQRTMGGTDTRITTLEAISPYLRCEPWQLLIPDFDVEAPPRLLTPEVTEVLTRLLVPKI